MAEQAPPATGTFCWNELITRDSAAGRKFYTQLLGWTTREMDMGPAGTYTIFRNGDKDVGGCMQMGKEKHWEGVPPHWLSYVSVADVDATTKQAEKLGGKVLVQPTDIPQVGRFSVICDPTGGVLALMTFK